MGATWKIGQLARTTGLTVRTLHHYDQIGLLTPSDRTPAGHRLYTEADVHRLYAVTALRGLRVPLRTVAQLLHGSTKTLVLLREHLAQLDRQLTAARAVRARLALLVRTADGNQHPPGATELLDLIEQVNTAERTFQRYFSTQQLTALLDRGELLGETTLDRTADQWPALVAAVQAEMDAGTPPTDPKAAALARRWQQLLTVFHGDDPELRESLFRMRAEHATEISEQGGPGQAMVEYITLAQAADPTE